MSTHRTFLLCFAPLPGGCVAFDSALVGKLSAAAPAATQPAAVAGQPRSRALDLIEHFGLPPPPASAERRVLVVSRGDLELMIVVGEEVRLETVELTDLLALPPMLEGIQATTGITGLVRRDQELAMFMDIDILDEIARTKPIA